ncbi:unnamed protein product, partial [Mesorhabditis spiculigera]
MVSTTTLLKQDTKKVQQKLPTIDEIKAAIPAQCFEKSLPKSLFFLVLDYVILFGCYKALPYFEAYGWTGYFIWCWVTGMFAASLFCIGHDCGHTTFSEYEWVNDLCGHIAHAPIMAPYWPWQKSHRQHHQYTSHLTRDKGHPWVTEEEYVDKPWFFKHFAKFPISGLLRWNPIYTFVGLPDGSHFWPGSELFTSTADRVKCAVSAVAVFFCMGVAFHLSNYSVNTWFWYYYMPCLWQGLWLVVITYMQHSHPEIEVFEEGSWNYMKGQVQTIDRTYGFGVDTLLHHITDGHVAHHMFFTRIPHYHLMEATEAIKGVLDKYPGAYKHETNYHVWFKYLWYNVRFEYLIGKGTGVLRYKQSGEDTKKAI